MNSRKDSTIEALGLVYAQDLLEGRFELLDRNSLKELSAERFVFGEAATDENVVALVLSRGNRRVYERVSWYWPSRIWKGVLWNEGGRTKVNWHQGEVPLQGGLHVMDLDRIRAEDGVG